MPVQYSTNNCLKEVCSVTDMASLVKLSRARFYDLVADGVFQGPVYSVRTRRPMFTRDMQQRNIEVRQSQRGINGEFVLFYEPRHSTDTPQQTSRRSKSASKVGSDVTNLKSQLRGLGIDASTEHVEQAVAACFPDGVDGNEDGEVLRTVFRHLRRMNSA